MSFATDIETSFVVRRPVPQTGDGGVLSVFRAFCTLKAIERERETILRGRQRANKKLVKTGIVRHTTIIQSRRRLAASLKRVEKLCAHYRYQCQNYRSHSARLGGRPCPVLSRTVLIIKIRRNCGAKGFRLLGQWSPRDGTPAVQINK